MAVWKLIKFRVMDENARPVAWAKIEADIIPDMGYEHGYNLMFPKGQETYTNEYGIATMALMANDALDIPESKYLITITYNGKALRYLIRLTTDMPDSVDFTDLIDMEKVWQKMKNCRNKDRRAEDGHPIIIGEKLFL